MLLQRLAELGARGEQPPPMYQKAALDWVVRLDRDGKLMPPLVSARGDAKKGEAGRTLLVPNPGNRSGGKVKAALLCDRADYALGVAEEGEEERTAILHAAFVKAVEDCAAATKEADVEAVAAFLRTWKPKKGALPKDLQPRDRVAFSVAGRFATDLPSVRAYWAGVNLEQGASVGRCLVCGQEREVERRLQLKVKGIPGGQSAGTALISGNFRSVESYGLEESRVSPICRTCAEASHNALNALLKDRRSSLRIGESLVWVFWARDDAASAEVLSFLDDPDPGKVRDLLASPRGGKDRSASLDATDFYAAAFSASVARVVVRDYLETSTERVKGNVQRWFRMQRLLGPDGEERPLGVTELSKSLLPRRKNVTWRDLPPTVPQTLVRAALDAGPLPDGLLHLVIRRNRAEQGVTRPRAVLTKMVLVSKLSNVQEELMTMDPDNREPAYLCGRLFEELEQAQRAALGRTSTTIRDRYFGAASSSPAVVFGGLMRNSQAHLGKLRKEREGTYVAIDGRITDILSRLKDFPPTLDLHGQALFGLGYYHEKAFNIAAAKARKTAGARETEGDDPDG